jgi:hypothetical protein
VTRCIALLFALFAFAACGWDKPPDRAHGGSACGAMPTECVDGNPPVDTGECCEQGEVCGGSFPNVGCPREACCYEGTDVWPVGALQDGGAIAPERMVVRGPQLRENR